MIMVAPPPPAYGPRRALRRQAAVRRINLMLDAVTGATPTLVAAWLAAVLLLSTQSAMLALLTTLGFCGALIAGLVGVGGAIVMTPLLLYVPTLLSFSPLDMHVVSGITMVQVAAAGVTGMLAHRQVGHVEPALVATLGGALAVGSLVGGFVSGAVPGDALTALFATLAAIAAALMLAGRQVGTDVGSQGTVHFRRAIAAGMGAAVGLLVGMIGAGGGFLLVPLMVRGLKVSLRVAVGSSLAIVALGGVAGLIGKAISDQVAWVYALALVVGALPGARLGATASRRLSTVTLGWILGVLLALVAIRMWWDVLASLL